MEPTTEPRVSVVPNSIGKLRKLGFEVLVSRGAGEASGYSDELYAGAGARIVDDDDALGADLVVSIEVPDVSKMTRGQMLTCVADPFREPERARAIIEKGITLLSLESIPRRLSKGQSMDVNSSQDNLSGYRAALLAAERLPKLMPMMTTAAGTVRPARFVIQGAAVAGLQAIATARRLGAIVQAIDVRLAAKADTESLGARFIDVPGWVDAETESGHAASLFDDPELMEAFDTALEEALRDADVLITTARIFGRDAPRLFFSEHRNSTLVSMMRPGSIIVDMNTDTGGNTLDAKQGEVIDIGGVTILGIPFLCRQVPNTASMLYSNNITNFVKLLVVDGSLSIDESEQVLTGDGGGIAAGYGGVLIASGGEVHAHHTRLIEILGGGEEE